MRRFVLPVVTIALLFSLTYSVGQSSAEAHRTTLHWGWNAVGWLGEPTTFGDLFAQLPQDVLEVYLWDSREESWTRHRRSSATESTGVVSVGESIVFWSPGTQTVEWHHPRTVLVKPIALETGANVVGWAGAHNTPFQQVVESVGDALKAAAYWNGPLQKWEYLNSANPQQESKSIKRGDVLWMVVDEDARYHPAGRYPKVTLWGEGHTSATVLTQVDNAVRQAVDFIDERYQLYAFVGSGWSIAFRVEDWLEGWQGREFANTPTETTVQQLHDLYKRRDREGHKSGCFGLANSEGLLLAFFPDSQRTAKACLNDSGSGMLVHEYVHVVQHAFEYPITPSWLVEGHARWVQYFWLLQSGTLSGGPESLIRHATRQAERCSSTSLSTTSYDDIDEEGCSYVLGLLAVAVLVGRYSDDDISMWSFWERSNKEGYYDAFQSTFGIALHDFYLEFAKAKARWVGAGCSADWTDNGLDMGENPECWSYDPQEILALGDVVDDHEEWEPSTNDLHTGEVVRLWSDYETVYFVTHSVEGSATVRHIPNWTDFAEANCAESDIRHIHHPAQQISVYPFSYVVGEFQRDSSRHCR